MTAPAIHPATPAAAGLLAALHEACFEQGWDENSMARLLAMPGAYGFYAAEAGAGPDPAPLGFILCRMAAREVEVLTIGVMPAARGQGIGAALLRRGLREAADRGAAEAFLEVAVDNDPAIALYRAAGFEQAGRRPGYYHRSAKGAPHGQGGSAGRVDAFILRRDLQD